VCWRHLLVRIAFEFIVSAMPRCPVNVSAMNATSLTRLCYAAMCVLAIGMNLPPVFLTTIRQHYALKGTLLNDEDLGRLAACPFIGLVIACVFTGPLADKYGAKVFCLAGNLCAFCGLTLCALAPSVLALSTALVVLGLGSGMLDMVLSPVIGALNADNRSGSMNYLHSMYCTGAVLTTLVVQFGLGWQASCLLLSAPPIIVCILFSLQSFPSITEVGVAHVSMRDLIRRPWFLVALAAIFLGGSAEMGLAQWLPTYCEQTLGYPHWLSGFALTLFNIAMAVGRIGIGYIGKRVCSYNVLAASCCVSFVLFILASFLPQHMALAAAVLVGMTGSPMWPTVMAVTADQFPGGGATMCVLLAIPISMLTDTCF
jgi:fucose permease